MASYLYKQKLSNQSQDEDYYILQPMFERHPPNQIISEKYAPDVVAQVRLINGKDERKNNAHFVPPKTRSQELQTYAGCFGLLDFLGKEYADKINQIVYLKFNNSKCNLIPNRKTRVLSAAFIPFQQFTSSISKLVSIPFPDSSQNAMLPTAKDSRGCSFDPIFCSNYQNSNLYAAIRKNPFEYELILQSDINSCETVCWFNFSIQFLQQGYYSFKIVNITEDMSKLYEKGLKISYSYLNPLTSRQSKKTGQGWGLCGENIKFTQGKIQREDKPGQFYYQLYFEFKCKNKHDIILFAPQVPYGLLESEKFFNKIVFKKIKNMLRIEKIQYGKSISGSPLVAYQIKRKKGRGQSIQMTPTATQTLLQGKDKRKSINLSPINKSLNSQTVNKSVIIFGRVKAADNNGSFIMEGMIDYLLDTIQFESMKRIFVFYFVPLVNYDGVRFGNSQTNLTGSLLNNNWKNPSKYYQSEIYQLKDLLQQINKENPLSLILNLTTDREDIYSSVIGCKTDSQETQDSRIFPFILSKRFRMFSFQKSTFFSKNQNSSICCVLSQLFPKSLVYQFNVSHFQTAKRNEQSISSSHTIDNEFKQSTPDSYRMFGKELLSNYLEHVKLYDKNLLLRQKWIKEIDEIENKMTKKIINFIEDKKVQQKFPEEFYYIPIQKQRSVPLIKSAKTSISTKILNPPKIFDIQRLSRDIKRQKPIKPMLPHSFNDFISKRNQTEGFLRTKIQLNGENKKLQLQQVINEKPIALYRVGEKKTSILLNCPSNTLNFQTEGNKIGNKSSKKQKNALEKQILKKELLTKLLRKVKIQDTVNGWKNKERSSEIKLGEIFSNS